MMRLNDWLDILKDGLSVNRTRRMTHKRRGKPHTATAVEALEDRTLLAAFLVNTAVDSVALDGQVSLREAITAANTNAAFMDAPAGDVGLDTISFAPALNGSTITLAGGELPINEPLDVTGPGAGSLTINANNASRIFNIADGTSDVAISDLTLTGGRADNGGAVAVGRGSVLDLNRAVISNSVATSNGGAIWNNGGSLSLIDSTLTGNTANFGGGIFARTFGDPGTGIVIENSTLDNNTAQTSGGGVLSAGGETVIRNSTLSANAALAGSGGGIRTEGGTLDLANTTITANSASTFGGGLDSAGGQITARNTLIAQNASGQGGLDVQGAFTTTGGNLIGDSTGATILGSTADDLLDVDPLLGPLQSNGGITSTHALLPGSPAIDAGVGFALTGDQRGTARPQGDFVDIGAFEADFQVPLLTSPTVSTNDLTPTFEWTPVPGADRYDLWVNDLTSGQNGIIRNMNVIGNSFTPTTALPDRSAFIWTVRAIFDDGMGGETFGDFASHRVFITMSAMAPNIIAPVGRSLDSTPTFRWTEIPGAARYDIWVNDRTTGQIGIIRNMNVQGTSFTPTTPLPLGHAFIWTVRAITDDGNPGEWAAHRTFVAGSLDAPDIIAPIGTINDTTPTFQWTSVTNADHYDLWVNNLTTGQNGVIREMNVQGTTFTPTQPLIDGHKYIWTVRAIGDNGFEGEWASHQIIRIDTSSTAPEPGQGDAIRVPGMIGQTVRVTATILEEEAAFDNEFGFFLVDDAQGRIGNLHPGDHGYAHAALTDPSRQVIWSTHDDLDDRKSRTFTTDLPGGSFVGLYLIQDASTSEFLHENPSNDEDDDPLAFFNFVQANPDGVHHLRQLHDFDDRDDKDRDDKDRDDKDRDDHHHDNNSNNNHNNGPNGQNFPVFGWEDWEDGGDRDFDDLVFRLSYDTTVDQTTAPEIISPVGTITTTTPVFQWTGVNAADHYEIWVNDLTMGHSGVIREMNVQGTTFTPTQPLIDGHQYIWTVRAVDSAGTPGEWATHRTFTVDTSSVPNGEAIRVPGMIGQTVRVTATILEEEAAFDNEFGFFLVDDAQGRIGNLHPGDHGYAHAALTDPSRQVVWSTHDDLDDGKSRTFTTDLPGGSFVGLYLIQDASTSEFLHENPSNDEDDDPLAFFNFVQANPDGVHHLRQLHDFDDRDDKDRDGKDRDDHHDDNSNNNHNNGPNGQNFPVFGWEDWEDGGDRDFDDLVFRLSYDTTVDQTTAPEIISPVGTITTTTPVFQWTGVNAADHYEIWVNDLTMGHSGVIREMNVQGTTFTPTQPLIDGHQYIWTVRAIDSAGTPGEWATHRTFTIDVPTSGFGATQTATNFSAAAAEREGDNGPALSDEASPQSEPDSGAEILVAAVMKEAQPNTTSASDASMISQTSRSQAAHKEPVAPTNLVDAVLADWKNTEWWASDPSDGGQLAQNSEPSESSQDMAAALAVAAPLAMTFRKRPRRRTDGRS